MKLSKDYVLNEYEEQILFVDWLNLKQIRFTASANGGLRHIVEGKKLKRLGVSKGFPDIEIPIPKGRFHGLYIEMKKTKGGKTTADQERWLKYLNEQGYLAIQANGFDKAKEIVEGYMKL